MQAAIMTQYGSAKEAISFVKDAEIPQISKPSQVKIKLSSASINPVDYKIRFGALRPFLPSKYPYILGRDGCGVIDEVGVSAKRFKVGDRVMGVFAGNGSHAQYVVCEETDVCKVPDNVDDKYAAALPLIVLTVTQMYTTIPELAEAINNNRTQTLKNKRILVLGGSGGTGSIGVLLAKHYFGAYTYAVCSTRNLDYVKKLGADRVIDYTSEQFDKVIVKNEKDRGNKSSPYVDYVIDCVGELDNKSKAYSIMNSKGHYVTIAVPDKAEKRQFGAIIGLIADLLWSKIKYYIGYAPKLANVVVTENGDQLFKITSFLQKKDLIELIKITEYDLKDIHKVHEQAEEGRTVGKIVIKIPE